MFRKTLFWLHLGSGVAAGLIILMMSVTGVILAYERQIQVWEDRSYYTEPEAGAERLAVDELLNIANGREGFSATSIAVGSDPSAPAYVRMGRSQSMHLNPYTGEIYAPHSDSLSSFFATVRGIHRWFNTSGETRATARDITGAANLLFFFLLISGMYLWLPKIISWSTLKIRIWFNPMAQTGQARDYNWHHVFAFWAALPLLVIIPTATVFNYSWANAMVYRLAGDEPPQRSAAAAEAVEPPAVVNPLPLQTLLEQAQTYREDWRTITLTVPDDTTAETAFIIDEGNGGEPQKRHSLRLDRVSGAEASWVPFQSQSSGVKARRWVRFLHTGEALGLIGQTVAGLASLGAAFMVWTGLALALRRFLRWRLRQKQAQQQAVSST